tara:strand:+ start:1141 stop:1380 length:240 start_codon:yes stop_codon:yes gene_type:complete
MYIIETFKIKPPPFTSQMHLPQHQAACRKLSIQSVTRFEEWINTFATNGYRVAPCNNLGAHFHNGGLMLKDITVFFTKN